MIPTNTILSHIGLHELCNLHPPQIAICPFCLSQQFFVLFNSQWEENWYYCKACHFSGDILDIAQTKLGLKNKQDTLTTLKQQNVHIAREDEILHRIHKYKTENNAYKEILQEGHTDLKNHLEQVISILNAQFNLSFRPTKNKFLATKLTPFAIYLSKANPILQNPTYTPLKGLNIICQTLPGSITGFHRLNQYGKGRFISLTDNTKDPGFILNPQLWGENHEYVFIVPPSIFFHMQLYAPAHTSLPLVSFFKNTTSWINLYIIGKPVFWFGSATPDIPNHRQMLQIINSQAFFIPYIPPLAEKYYLRQNPQHILEFLLRFAKPWQEVFDHFLTHANFDEVHKFNKKFLTQKETNPSIACLMECHPELKSKWEKRLYGEGNPTIIKRIKSKRTVMYETASGWFSQSGELLISGHIKPLYLDENDNLHIFVHILPDDTKGIVSIPVRRLFTGGIQALQEEILNRGLGYLYIDENVYLSYGIISFLMKLGRGPIPRVFSREVPHEISACNRPGWSDYLQEFILEGKSYRKFGLITANNIRFFLPDDHPFHHWSQTAKTAVSDDSLKRIIQALTSQHICAIEDLRPLPIVFTNIPEEKFTQLMHSLGAVSEEEAAHYFHILKTEELVENFKWPFYFTKPIPPDIDLSYSFALLHESQQEHIKKGQQRILVTLETDGEELARYNTSKSNLVGQWANKIIYRHFCMRNTTKRVDTNTVKYFYAIKSHEELQNIGMIMKMVGLPPTEPVLDII